MHLITMRLLSWHSNYSPYQALPATVEIDMKEVHTINQFDYLPRQDGNTNGQITKYEYILKKMRQMNIKRFLKENWLPMLR